MRTSIIGISLFIQWILEQQNRHCFLTNSMSCCTWTYVEWPKFFQSINILMGNTLNCSFLCLVGIVNMFGDLTTEMLIISLVIQKFLPCSFHYMHENFMGLSYYKMLCPNTFNVSFHVIMITSCLAFKIKIHCIFHSITVTNQINSWISNFEKDIFTSLNKMFVHF